MSSIKVADLFAGAGGTSEGVRLAGLELAFAANHWPLAVDLHARRHPAAQHVCQDLTEFDFRRMPRVDILWASPSCQGHSEAAQPARARDLDVAVSHDHLRSSAWAVIRAVLARQPRAFVVENVPQFMEWSPAPIELSSHTTRRAAEREAERVESGLAAGERARVRQAGARWLVLRHFAPGVLFRHWLATFALSGYHVTQQVLTASRWGVPQRRRRLILVGHLDRELAIRDPDTSEPTLDDVLRFDAGEWTAIRSIGERGVDGKTSARDRAEHAHATFGGQPCWGFHASHRGAWARSVSQPANTITTQNQHYMVRGGKYRLWSVPETAQVMGFDPDYFDGVDRTCALVMAGNAVPPPMAAGILRLVAASL